MLLAGCTTVVKYDAKTVAGPAKPADYPICVYMEQMKVPRPFEIIGTVHVGDTPFTVKGGSFEEVMMTLQELAQQKGADAIQITAIETPGFTSSHYRVDANFLRFTDAWETVPLSENEFLAYLKDHQQSLDPIEGIWSISDVDQSRVGIIKDSSRPGRDFIAFVINTNDPSWPKGSKKIDIARGNRPAVYLLDYYFDDFQKKEGAISLGDPPAGLFHMRLPDGSDNLIFNRQ